MLSLPLHAGLFVTAVTAGAIDAVAGGGGLLCVPMLLAAGLSPAQTLATNKFQGSFGTFSATFHYLRAGEATLGPLVPAILAVFCAAIAGTVTVQALDPSFLRLLLPPLLAGVALYVLLSPRIGDEDRHPRMGRPAFAVSVAPLVGFYDGFFGPGAGSFFTVGLVEFLGLNLRRATAETKVLNLTSNVASLLVFLAAGQVMWSVALTMAAGQALGARLGSRAVIRRGAGLVRPCLVVMSLALTVKLVGDDFDFWPRFAAAAQGWLAAR